MKNFFLLIATVVATTCLFAQGQIPVKEEKTKNVSKKTKETNKNFESNFDFKV